MPLNFGNKADIDIDEKINSTIESRKQNIITQYQYLKKDIEHYNYRIKGHIKNKFEDLYRYFKPTKQLKQEPILTFICESDSHLKEVYQILERSQVPLTYTVYTTDKLIDENEYYNEYLFQSPKYSCTAKITVITPVEVGIDFNISTYSIIGMGKGIKYIKEFYEFIDSRLSFKGSSLYRG